MEKENLLVFKPKVARQLLKMGYQIIDIKAAKENPDRTIFVFKRTEEILNAIHSVG